VALRVDGFIWKYILASELAVINMSGYELELPWKKIAELETLQQPRSVENPLEVQVLTEEKIRSKTLDLLKKLGKNDSVKIVMFYLSDRKVINSLLETASRGVEIKIVLDPNKDAFGRRKNGIPNRPVAKELLEKSNKDIDIRWCDTRGEQCHSKLILIKKSGTYFLNLGSANLTRRNLGNYNLETNLLVSGPVEAPAINEASIYFETIWHNKLDRSYTVPYSRYGDDSTVKEIIYRVMEATGFCSF
jgi:HKD family nuclease